MKLQYLAEHVHLLALDQVGHDEVFRQLIERVDNNRNDGQRD